MSKVLDLLEQGKFPIVHPNQGLDTCEFCCPIDINLYKQCTHYLIVDSYDENLKEYYVRLVTNSNNYIGNKQPGIKQYEKYLFKFFTVSYYTTNLFSITEDCINDLPIIGHFNYL